MVPFPMRPWPWRILLPALGSLAFALCGVLFGYLGWRRRRRLIPGLALLINAVALVLGLLLAAAVFWILPPNTF
jgi:hypothetical protein